MLSHLDEMSDEENARFFPLFLIARGLSIKPGTCFFLSKFKEAS